MTNRTLKDYILLGVKGACMGAADVVPGVSGGTIAFISGIYEELINSIRSINATAVRLLLKGRLKEFWRAINGNFLVSILAGILFSIVALVKAITYLLEHEPILIWSFFFGLVLASSVTVCRTIERKTLSRWVAFLIGAVGAYFITVATPAETPTGLWFIFLCGAIAICAMILPGISGSFILLLMGKYTYIMGAVKGLISGTEVVSNLLTLCCFAVGALIGIVSFSNLLSWLLSRWKDVTIALLGGFMFGSLNKIWPWKEVVETYVNSHGEVKPLVEVNIAPNGQVLPAILLAVIGFAVVIGIEVVANRKK
jgi:putative membrane protein